MKYYINIFHSVELKYLILLFLVFILSDLDGSCPLILLPKIQLALIKMHCYPILPYILVR